MEFLPLGVNWHSEIAQGCERPVRGPNLLSGDKTAPVALGKDGERIEMEIVPGVHQIEGLTMANVFLIVGQSITIIDAGTKQAGKKILHYIERIGRSPNDVERIVLTHHHFDHVGSLARLRQATGAQSAAHSLDALVIEGKESPQPFNLPPVQRLLFAFPNMLMKPSPVRVDVRLADGEVLDVLGGLQVVHTPGHTPGSISLWLKEKGVIFVGDAIVNQADNLTGASEAFSLDMAEANRSVHKIAALDFEVCCFSHGTVIRSGADKRIRELAKTL